MSNRTAEVSAEVPLPLYHQVYVVLRQQIAEGAFPPEQAMPGEHELAASFAVSRITIRRALMRLEAEGLVVRRRGAGTFARPPAAAEPLRDNLRGLIENLIAMGLRTSVRLIEVTWLPASPEVARALGLKPGEAVQKSVRVRSVRGTPFSHLTAWVPERIGRCYRESDLATQPLLHLIERAGVGIARAEQTISARLADPTTAPLLGIEVGSALLWVRRTVFGRDGRAVEAIEALYRPDMYEYGLDLARGDGTWTTISPASR